MFAETDAGVRVSLAQEMFALAPAVGKPSLSARQVELLRGKALWLHRAATAGLPVTPTIVLTRALLPGMIERAARDSRRAGLLMVSSTTAFQPVPFLATYSASKSFILAYGEALATELRRKPVDVLVLCPGATRTNFGRRAGFALNALPGAADPMDVAREGLHALGRHTVHVHGFGTRNMLRPFLWSRHAASDGLGAVLAVFDRSQRLGRGFRSPPRA